VGSAANAASAIRIINFKSDGTRKMQKKIEKKRKKKFCLSPSGLLNRMAAFWY
jgi:hypothetical protein